MAFAVDASMHALEPVDRRTVELLPRLSEDFLEL
jgi:hypothetical protein